MAWLLTVEAASERGTHKHIDVGDPAQAAAVINEISDSTNAAPPLRYIIVEYHGSWRCGRAGCGSWRIAPGTIPESAQPG